MPNFLRTWVLVLAGAATIGWMLWSLLYFVDWHHLADVLSRYVQTLGRCSEVHTRTVSLCAKACSVRLVLLERRRDVGCNVQLRACVPAVRRNVCGGRGKGRWFECAPARKFADTFIRALGDRAENAETLCWLSGVPVLVLACLLVVEVFGIYSFILGQLCATYCLCGNACVPIRARALSAV